jgi:signal transduction histidine kinase/DNA-binding response OmpR family regulator/HAMP domain-containing protein
MMILGLLTTIGIIIFARKISGSISKPVEAISTWAKNISNGSLEVEEVETRNDEIGEMKESVLKVVASLNSVAEICEEIAVGKLDHEFIVRSDHDRLGESINTMRNSFIQVIHQANAISKSDYSVSVVKRSEHDELAIALIDMVTQLKEASEIATSQAWIKNGQSNLNKIIQNTDNNQQLSKEAIAFICKYLDAKTGVMLVKSENAFAVLGSYAFNIRNNDNFKITEGEGLLGQAILEKEVIYLKDVPNDMMKIESASIDIQSNHVIVIPCLFEDDVKGVIEIASYTPFTDHHIEFLNKIQENIAIAIHSNITREELQALLNQTLIQSEELKKNEQILTIKNEELSQQTQALRESESKLQQQQEELRQSNEELEAQTMELKASEGKLQQQQEELRVTNEELEEKTINLQKQKEEIVKKNEELEKTQLLIEEKAKEVEISSKYKSEFLANMSHELRTPLNSILILSGFLLEDKKGLLGDDEKEYAKVINAAGKDLLDLINDILDLSKIESGKMELNIEPFDIRNTLQELQGMFKPLIDEKGLNFINDVDASVPEMIVSDEMKIGQVMKNLLSNAIKFTQEGSIEVRTTITENHQLQIAVRDTGIGISKDKLFHIFGAFQQADGSTSRNYGGTGLGLSISKELTRLLGGDIKLESEENKGSTFYILIPVNYKEPKTDVENNLKNTEQENTVAISTEKDKKGLALEEETGTLVKDENQATLIVELPSEYESVILIIEDDKNFASILEKVAKERGHDVVCVDSGEQALLVADRIDVSAVILDLGLPGMSGWEVLQRFKKWKKTQDIPVHIMSGKELDHQHSNLEFIDYLQKPISFDKLYGAFDQIEQLIRQDIKKLLLVTSDNDVADEIETEFNKTIKDIKLKRVTSGDEVIRVLKEKTYDCIVMVSDLVDTDMAELAKKIRVNDISQTPIILYMKKELPYEMNDELTRYVESIIIAGDKSMRRLIDESTLFLNHIEETHRDKVTEFMKTSSEKEAILVGKTVLIVDDDMRNTFALSSVLEDRGMKVLIAKNGQLGIEKLQEHPEVDIVLMDIMMPVMDGYTAMRKIRGMKESFSKVPIIALTAKAMREDKDKCISAGASDYLAKPIKMDELQTLMKVWIY